MGVRLSDFRGRDNNFNLLRMVAALMVIEAHACGVTRHPEPLGSILGISTGDFGVDIFFVLSGYLITKSWTGKTWKEFAWARLMRIYPALWVSTAVSILLVAAFFTRNSATAFLMRPSTLSYFWHNATMLPHFAAQTALPGAFGLKNPDFNVSLWTLPYELQMYMLLALVASLAGTRAWYMAAIALAGAGIVITAHFLGFHADQIDRGRFLYFFFSGAFAFTLRDKIVLSGWLAAALAVVVAASWLTTEPIWRETALVIALPYLIFWLAYVPGGPLRVWNLLGDYSYGTYILAHPVQIGLYTLGVAVSWRSNMLLSTAIVLPLACISWHALEKRALAIPLPTMRSRQTTPTVAHETIVTRTKEQEF
jgi:peptidoglycan/LPS O-acetylase OafA/YrhL